MTNTPGDGQTPPDPTEPSAPHPGGQPPQGPGWTPPPGQQGYYPASPGYYPPQPPPHQQYATDHPKATMVLVLGILGVVLCQVIAPFAWVMGKRTVAEIDESQGRLGGRGSAQAGYILGVVGSVILGVSLLFMLGVVLIAVIGAAASA